MWVIFLYCFCEVGFGKMLKVMVLGWVLFLFILVCLMVFVIEDFNSVGYCVIEINEFVDGSGIVVYFKLISGCVIYGFDLEDFRFIVR